MCGGDVAGALNDLRLPGVTFHPHIYDSTPRSGKRNVLNGVRIVVTDPDRFKPVLVSVSIIACLQDLYGRDRLGTGGAHTYAGRKGRLQKGP